MKKRRSGRKNTLKIPKMGINSAGKKSEGRKRAKREPWALRVGAQNEILWANSADTEKTALKKTRQDRPEKQEKSLGAQKNLAKKSKSWQAREHWG